MGTGFLNRRVPTLFALFLLFLGIGVTLFIVNNTTVFRGEAAPEDEPKNIRISNVSSNSLTVSFVTASDVLTSITYGQNSTELSEVAAGGSTVASSTHSITLLNLTPQTDYYFKIISGTREYSDEGSPFMTSTAPQLPDNPASKQAINGTVLDSNGTPAPNALVYLTADSAGILSSKTTESGSFEIDASLLTGSDLSSYYKINDSTQLRLTALNSKSELSAVFSISQANPLPPTTLGQSYNFTLTDTTPEASSSAEESAVEVDFPIFSSGATEDRVVSIDTPEANETFSDQRPEFQGTALPNEVVEITIQSQQEIKTSVTASSNGVWEYRPETPLEPGNHNITVKTRDENGILRVLTRPFTVYAQGSQFTEPSVSPSAPTATPTVAVTISPTASPSAVQTPTPTVLPTQTPVPTIFTTPTPMPPVDPTGPTNIPLVIVSSVAVLISGIFFYLLTKMNSI